MKLLETTRYLAAIEERIRQGQQETALQRLGSLLSAFAAEDPRAIGWIEHAGQRESESFFTRLATAATSLFESPAVEFTAQQFHQFTGVMPELAHTFLLSGYRSADHVLDLLVSRASSGPREVNFASQSDARKFLLCSSIYGSSVETLVSLLERAPQAAAASVLGALSAHVTGAPQAQQNRNRLLQALECATEVVPSERMLWNVHRAWTLCSYATFEQRHDVKRHMNAMIRNWLKAQDLGDQQLSPERSRADRPTLLVACEVAGGGHVMSRCYEPFLEQLQRRFRVVLLVAESDLGDERVPWCDELVKFDWTPDRFGDVIERINQQRADIIYYPCLGMRLWPVITSNLRLAPLQIASLGHPATTHSPHIDYMIGGDLVTGPSDRYSEKVVRFQAPGNLYRLDREQERFARQVSDPKVIRVAVCANMLKLNSDFLAACGVIAQRVSRQVQFEYMPNCIGMKLLVVRQQVDAVLGGRAAYRVHPRQRCAQYLEFLSQCDLFLSPFPFGGENSMLDAVLQGLPAVSLCGDEPHTRLDARVMKTAELPDWLVTSSVEEYIAAATRLIDEPDVRLEIMRRLVESDLESRFAAEHDDYPDDFVDTMWGIYERQFGG